MLGAPFARSSSAQKLPHKTESGIIHVFVGLAVLMISYSLLWLSFPSLLVEAVTGLLSVAQVSVTRIFDSTVPLLVIKLMDGSNLELMLTEQRCGLVSIAVFGFLFLLVMHPFRGSIWLKLAWLEFGFLAGLTWSLLRLLIAVLLSYHLGPGAFAVVNFLIGPLTDVLWVVAVWSLMLSTLTPKKSG